MLKMSKNVFIIIGVLVTTATLGFSIPAVHASTLNGTFTTAFNGFHFSSLRSIFREKVQKEIQTGKENAAKNRNERNAMLAAQTNGVSATSTDTDNTDPAHTLTVSWISLTNIESWMISTTTAAAQNGADVSKIQPLLDSAQDDLDLASSSIHIITSSTTAMGIATSSIDSAKTDLMQALELLKTIVNN
jgi:hypothetical protein